MAALSSSSSGAIEGVDSGLPAHEASPPAPETTTGSPISTSILISNLHCSSCSITIRQVLTALSPPPLSIYTNILTHEVTIIHPAGLPTSEVLRALLEAEFKIDSFTSGNSSELSGSGGYGSVISFERFWSENGGEGNASASTWLDEARENLRSAFESGKKRKRHLSTCELCKGERGQSSSGILVGSTWCGLGGASETPEAGLSTYMNREKPGASIRTVPYSLPRPVYFPDTHKSSSDNNATMELPGVNKSQMATIDERDDDLSSGKLVEDKGILVGYDGATEFEKALPVPIVVTTTVPSVALYDALFSIDGMTCSACTGRVTETIQALPFVRNVEVNLMSNSATVKYEGREEDAAKVVDEVEAIGYDCALENVKELGGDKAPSKVVERTVYEALFSIDGMTCSACSGRVTETIKALPFVRTVEVNLMSNSATVQYEGEEEDASKVVDEVEAVGYDCALESIKVTGVIVDTNKVVDRSVAIRVEGMFCEYVPQSTPNFCTEKHC